MIGISGYSVVVVKPCQNLIYTLGLTLQIPVHPPTYLLLQLLLCTGVPPTCDSVFRPVTVPLRVAHTQQRKNKSLIQALIPIEVGEGENLTYEALQKKKINDSIIGSGNNSLLKYS